MKIPLNYSGYIFISGLLDIPGLRIRLKPFANAIIDTGSPETILSEGQALQWGIPLSNLTFARNTNLGGTVYELYKLGTVTIKFKDEAGTFQNFQFSDMCVARTTKSDEKSKQLSQAMPSIFGTNFLLVHKFGLHFTPHKNQAYLEKEE